MISVSFTTLPISNANGPLTRLWFRLTSIVASQFELFEELRFEYAYSLYKLNRFAESLLIVNQSRQLIRNKRNEQCSCYMQIPVNWDSKEDRKFALLEAQVVRKILMGVVAVGLSCPWMSNCTPTPYCNTVYQQWYSKVAICSFSKRKRLPKLKNDSPGFCG